MPTADQTSRRSAHHDRAGRAAVTGGGVGGGGGGGGGEGRRGGGPPGVDGRGEALARERVPEAGRVADEQPPPRRGAGPDHPELEPAPEGRPVGGGGCGDDPA